MRAVPLIPQAALLRGACFDSALLDYAKGLQRHHYSLVSNVRIIAHPLLTSRFVLKAHNNTFPL